jgi:hypothetical protein
MGGGRRSLGGERRDSKQRGGGEKKGDGLHGDLRDGRDLKPAYNCSMTAAAGTSLPSPFKVVHTVCSHDCPDSCGVLVTVDGAGRAVKVQGDPEHPVTQGFLCGKVAKYLDRVYAPERLLYPLKRKAGVAKGPLKRGEERVAFEQVSWDEALDAIAARLKAVAEEFGPESILPYSYAGTIGQLGYGSMDRRFFHRLGASQLDRTICSEAGGEAWKLVYGKKLGTPPEDYRLANLVLAWGANIHGNNVHLWPMIEQARRARRAADCDRSLQDEDGGAGGLAHRDQAGNGWGAGAGHDAGDPERGAGGSGVHRGKNAWVCGTGRAGEGVHAGARGRVDGDDGGGD